MTPEKIRHKKQITGTLSLIICGVLYYCFTKITGWSIPCLFRLATGLKCPGCGISTMLSELAEGNLTAAFRANRFLFVTAPFLIFELVFLFLLEWKGKRSPKWNEVLLIVYAAALIVFGVLRNTAFPFT